MSGPGRELVVSLSAGDSSPSFLIDSVLATLTSDRPSKRTRRPWRFSCPGQRNGGNRFRNRWSKPGAQCSLPAVSTVSSVNQRLSAVRLLFRQAADRGALTVEEALRLASVPNVKQGGQRLGQWLTEGEAGKLLGVPEGKTRIGIRDRPFWLYWSPAGCAATNSRGSRSGILQLRDERWVLLDIQGREDGAARCRSRSG